MPFFGENERFFMMIEVSGVPFPLCSIADASTKYDVRIDWPDFSNEITND